MQKVDTNVVVRMILGDDQAQAAQAAECWRAAVAQGDIYIPRVVLVETVWVLSLSAKLSRERIATELRRLMALEKVVIEGEGVVAEALSCYEQSAADFADCLILMTAREANALPVHTFDQRFSRHAGGRRGAGREGQCQQ